MRDVRRVRDVDDEWSEGGGVLGVAAEEGWARVEAEVDEGVYVGNGGEGGAVADGGVEGALVGGDEGGAVGPEVLGVSARIDGKNDVYSANGLDERVQRDVLEILAAVHEGEFRDIGVAVRGGVVMPEGVGGVLRDVVVILSDVFEDGSQDLSEQVRRRAVDAEDELVEERGGGAKDVAGVVEATHARGGGGENAAVEFGTEVAGWRETIGGWVPGAHLEGVEFVDCGVEGDDYVAWRAAVGDDNGEGHLSVQEVVL